MADTPRTRIAAAMWAELQRQSQEKPKEALYVADADARYESGEVGLIDGHVNVSELADAVIRELGLQPQSELYKCGPLMPNGFQKARLRHRYVTEWTADE